MPNAEKATRLHLVHTINVQQLLVANAAERMSIAITPEQLNRNAVKIYQVASSPERPDVVLLATSYGPLVLHLDLSIGPHAGCHHRWQTGISLYSHDNYVRVIRSPAFDRPEEFSDGQSSGSAASKAGSIVIDLADVSIAEKKIDSTGLVSGGGSAELLVANRSRVYPSPSGRYCAFHWPESGAYIILSMASFQCSDEEKRAERPPSTASPSSVAMAEIDSGHASEFAWIGEQDHYLIKCPPHFLLSEQRRRSSIFAFNKSNAQVNKTFRPSCLVLKQVMETGKVADVHREMPVADYPSERVMDLFSGGLLCVNFVNTKDKDLLSEEGGLSPKSTFTQQTYAQFVCWQPTSSSLLACSPIMSRVVRLSWDYITHRCLTLHDHGVINLFALVRTESKVSLQALHSLTCHAHDLPIQSLNPFGDIHVVSSYAGMKIYATEASSKSIRGPLSLHESLQIHDMLHLSHAYVWLLHRDGSLRLVPIGTDGRILQFLAGSALK